MAEKREPQAKSNLIENRNERSASALASGLGASAGAGGDHARADGTTSAAASFGTAIATNTLPAAVAIAAKEVEDFPERLKLPALATLQKVAQELLTLRTTAEQMKATVDDIWAAKAADEVRNHSAVKGWAKELLSIATETGSLAALAKVLLPK
jgi:hypothetical protein